MQSRFSLPANIPSLWFWSITFVLTAFSFFFHLNALAQTNYSNGWDGYFYLVQIKSVVNEGNMHSPDSSLIYPLVQFFYWLSGDFVLGLKLTIAFLSSLFVVAIACFSLNYSKNTWIALILIVWASISPQLTYFAAQYPKNLLGVVFLLFFIAFYSHRLKWIPAIFLVSNIFGHRITFVIALLFLLLMMISGRNKKYYIFAGIGIILVFAISAVFPGLISIYDLKRFSGEFSFSPQFAPLSFYNEFGPGFFTNMWQWEIIILSALYCLTLFYVIYSVFSKKLEKHISVMVFLLTVLIFPFFTWSLDGFAIRLLFIFLLLCPLLISFLPLKIKPLPSILFALLLLIFGLFSEFSYKPAIQDPPYNKFEAYSNRILELNEDFELIIAHKALAEFITFETDIDAMPWIPDYEIRKDKLWRMVADIQKQELFFYLGRNNLDSVFRIGLTYFLMPEYKFQEFLLELRKDSDNMELLKLLMTWKNPHEERPYYLGKDRR